MSIRFEKTGRTNGLLMEEGNIVIRCDVCDEPITGTGVVEYASEDQYWFAHKTRPDGRSCSYSLACHLREQGI